MWPSWEIHISPNWTYVTYVMFFPTYYMDSSGIEYQNRQSCRERHIWRDFSFREVMVSNPHLSMTFRFQARPQQNLKKTSYTVVIQKSVKTSNFLVQNQLGFRRKESKYLASASWVFHFSWISNTTRRTQIEH